MKYWWYIVVILFLFGIETRCVANKMVVDDRLINSLSLCGDRPLKLHTESLGIDEELFRIMITDMRNPLHIINVRIHGEKVFIQTCKVTFGLRKPTDINASPLKAWRGKRQALSLVQAYNVRSLWKKVDVYRRPEIVPSHVLSTDGLAITIEAAKRDKSVTIARGEIMSRQVRGRLSSSSEASLGALITYLCGLAEVELFMFEAF